MKRPPFSLTMTPPTFQQFYWYKSELVQLCRQYELPTRGTKAELTAYLSQRLAGRAVKSIQPVRKAKRNQHPNQPITVDTLILATGFRLNQAAREFFAHYYQVERFQFKKCMAVKMRQIEATQDQQATVKDLINVYDQPASRSQNTADPEERTYQWNHFVRDFSHDAATKAYRPLMKVAAILWQHVRDSPGQKRYDHQLLQKYAAQIEPYRQGKH